jgi:hypothetical protein
MKVISLINKVNINAYIPAFETGIDFKEIYLFNSSQSILKN